MNPGQPQAAVDLRIDPSHIRFETDDGVHSGKLRVAVFCADGHQRIVGELWETMEMKIREKTWRKVLVEGLPYSARVPPKASATYVKVVVYDPGNNKVGSRVIIQK